ncbi:hypothetical protein J6590_014786 [Homalodisca vitripennis]|nr:hypothetical protein J6590_014786 [Homalodisca vitripennis]
MPVIPKSTTTAICETMPRAKRVVVGGLTLLVCGTCGKRFKYKANLGRHLRYECGVEPQFPCPQCPYRNDDVRKHKCCTCGKRYKNKGHLSRHLRYECDKEPQFTCSYCPYRTKRQESLLTHMVLKHHASMS